MIYLIAYATLVVTGGRLGDIYGTRNVFVVGVAVFFFFFANLSFLSGHDAAIERCALDGET
jgi:MFS family permease